jgi:peptide/nickel transport system substrate-binding protein
MAHNLKRIGMVGSAAVACVVVVGCSSSGSSGSGKSSAAESAAGGLTPRHGGSAVALVDETVNGNWPSGLDPATNTTGGAVLGQNQAIFGGLFLLEGSGNGPSGHIVGNQAESGKLSADGKTLTIKLRPGIKFSDGTPLDAKAVIWNFERDSKSSCTCAPAWELRKADPFTSPDPLTVQVHLSKPNASLLNSFPVSNVNWIASPTAFKKMGERAFKIKPVGAGPFTVVSDKLSSKLVLTRNPNYFTKDLPYLDKLTFLSIGGDQPAYQALLAGAADTYVGASTTAVIKQAEQSPQLTVTNEPGTSPWVVQLNTMIPPFNNIKAREAIYYATDFDAINKGLFDGRDSVVQSFITPADLFYNGTGKIPGYRGFDLAKAKQLVKQLGGLRTTLYAVSIYSTKQVMTALQTQWKKAGIQVTVQASTLETVIKQFNGGKWQAFLQTAGAWDPAVGVGLGFRFKSTSPFTGVKDPRLDKLVDAGVTTIDPAGRKTAYQDVAEYIAKQAYAPFGFALSRAQLAVKGMHGPGLTTKIPGIAVRTAVLWGQVWKEKS